MPQVACYAGELPGVAQFRDMLLTTFPRAQESLGTYNITRGCNVPGISEHEEGRALDWEAHVNDRRQDTQARQLLHWLTRHNGYQAKRLGIMYMIYDQHIWGQYNQRWRWMSDRGGITDNHKDHVHFSFTWNGALQRAAYWSGQARRVHHGPCSRYRGHFASLNVQRLANRSRTGSCPAPTPIPRSWAFGPSVMYWQQDSRAFWLQQFLSEEGFYDGEVNGAFDSRTYDAVRRYQVDHGLGTSGVWDPATQNESRRVVDKRQRSAVSWDVVDMTAAAGQQIPVVAAATAPVPVTPRSIRVEERPVGGEWETVGNGVTDQQGQWQTTVTAAAEPGATEYRVVVARTSYAVSAATRVRTITVAPAPLPLVGPPSTPSPVSSPSPGAP